MLILALAIPAAALLFTGCLRDEITLRVSCDDFYRDNVVAREMVVPVGDSFKISMCSNPSSVWEWPEEAAISDDSVIEQIGHKSVMIPLGGAPGQEIWTFRALKKGMGRVTIEGDCWQESSGNEIWRLELRVIID